MSNEGGGQWSPPFWQVGLFGRLSVMSGFAHIRLKWARLKLPRLLVFDRSPWIAGLAVFFAFFVLQIKFQSVGANMSPRSFLSWSFLLAFGLFFWLCRPPRQPIICPPILLAVALGPVVLLCLHIILSIPPMGGSIAYIMPNIVLALVLFVGWQSRLSKTLWSQVALILFVGLIIQTLLSVFAPDLLNIAELYEKIPSYMAVRYGGFYQENHFTIILASASLWVAVFFIFFAAYQNRFAAIIMLVCYLLASFTIFISASKMGMLALVLGVLCCAPMMWFLRVRRAAWARYAVLCLLLLMAYVAAAYCGVDETEGRGVWQSQSVTYRLTMWKISALAIKDNFLFGHGRGSFTAVYFAYFVEYGNALSLTMAETPDDPHNLIIWLLVETGLVGTLLFLLPMAWVGARLLAVRGQIIYLLPILPIAIHTMLEFPQRASGTHYLLFALILISLTHAPKTWPRFHLPRHIIGRQIAHLPTALLALATIAAFDTLMLSQDYIRKENYFRTMPDLRQAYVRRFASRDMRHFILGDFVLVNTLYAASSRAIAEQDKPALAALYPLYVRHVVRRRENAAIWTIQHKMLLLLENWAGLELFYRRLAGIRPQDAANIRAMTYHYFNHKNLPTSLVTLPQPQ